MSDLREAFQAAGFTDVRTVLASGNVVFRTPKASEESLRAKAEAALEKHLGRTFPTMIRSIDDLQRLLAYDPYKKFKLSPDAKRVVTFLRQAPGGTLKLPIERSGARILAVKGLEAFTAYVASSDGPVFMTLIERTLGKDVTTRTWDTVSRIARATV